MNRPSRHGMLHSSGCILTIGILLLNALSAGGRLSAAEEVLPQHITRDTIKAVRDGLDYLARTQSGDGGWHDGGAQAYPVALSALAGMAFLANGNTPTRGHYAQNVKQCTEYLLSCSNEKGFIASQNQDNGRPMHGHGFALMYLASVYGMETNQSLRTRTAKAIKKGIELTSRGASPEGGWYYIPGSPDDEGSVTVTQVQALRAAHNAGFSVPKGTIEKAVQYIERCSTPEGGISYGLRFGGDTRLAISAAAVATLYNAGEYDAPVAQRCLEYVRQQYKSHDGWKKGQFHEYYGHLYAAQGFYLSNDKYWDEYFPATRDQLLSMQNKAEGSWEGEGIGPLFSTPIALIILQLPYKYLPVFQR